MKISDKQQQILNKAISLLKEYDKEDVSDYTYYFVVSEDDSSEIGMEYDCCDNPECYKKTLVKLKKEYPDCCYEFQDNSNDYENIEYCYQCGRPLNDILTWIWLELNDIEDELKAENLKQSHFSYRMRVIFEAMPTCDEEIRGYDRADSQRLKEAIERQNKFVERVIKYAEQVIGELSKDGGYNEK